jgi:hypothetical protein
MNTDELEQRTREQIRELHEEYRQRLEPLEKILVNIYENQSMPPYIMSSDTAKSWGFSPLDSPEYRDAQNKMNRMYRDMIDAIPLSLKRCKVNDEGFADE